MRFTIILLFTFIFTSIYSFSQLEKKLNKQCRWTHFTTNDCLPSNNIRGIIVTPDGTVYAHSLKGISWYDGYKWNFIKGSEKISSEYNQHQFSFLSDSNYCIKYDKSIYIVSKYNIKNNIIFTNNNNYNKLNIIPYTSNRYLLLVNNKLLLNKYSLLVYTNNNEYNEVYSFINTEKEPILMQSNNG